MDENGTFHSIMQEDQDGKVTMMDDQGKASVVEEGKGMTESLVEQLVGFGATVVYANANEHEPLATFTLSAPKEDQPTQTTTIQPEKEVTPTESTITLTPEPTATEIATEQPTPKIEVPDLKLGMCTTWKEAAKCPISSEYWKNVNSLRKLIAWVKATDTDTFSDKVNITERPTFNTYATSNGHTSLVIWAPSVLDGFKKDPETKPYKWLRHFTTSYQNMNIIFSIQKIVTNNKTRYVPYMTASLNSKYYNEIERLYARIDAVPMGSTPFNSFNPESGPYNYSEPTVLAVRDRILKDWSDTGELPKEVEDYIWLQNID